ncbi:conjugative transfer signal peptidase TraF [Sphingomonas sp. NFR04]|uniref:S26 family signal peptidase n=1 Tax=Sphingomonas sp. NFR04 TaxID=1566283 RepID=UPI0008E23CAC|nr:S26 family signal peptidase [Sphingomonas sp. NFR04]SFJ97265.1 conjugative transfer signal peptidase TraF [Sphingomonas sp. NFR04]
MTRREKPPGELPLLAWADRRPAPGNAPRRLGWRAAAIGLGASLLALTFAVPPSPRLVWNASASAPIGLYAVDPGASIQAGDMVVARLPERWRALAARRRYLPANVPLVKQVVALAGDQVCAVDAQVVVNGRRVVERRSADGAGRPLPWWRGCIRLREGQFFLLMPGSPASFDGRYFGPTKGAQLVGKAILLWQR